MICGKWESYPREFAKCRRCRKAKYCGKECQSTAWSEGHRFWCSAKDVEEDVNATGVGHGNAATPATVGGGAGDHAQVQVQQQDQGDHGELSGIHIAGDNVGDGNVPLTAVNGGTPTTTTTTRPERRRHGMGHQVGDGVDISTFRHAANTATTQPGTFGHGLAGPGTAGTARAELSMSRDRTVQPQHHQTLNAVNTRPRPTIRPPATAADSVPSPTSTGTATATTSNFSMLQQRQLQDPMNASHLSFHIQTTNPSSSSPTSSSLTAEQRRVREQQQQQARSVMSRRRADTVTGSSSTFTSNSTSMSASLTPSQRAMVQAQLHLQEVAPNVVISLTTTGAASGHHHHHHLLRNQYQTQNQAGSSSAVAADWSMGSPIHNTPLSSSSSSSSAAAAVHESSPSPGPSSSSSSSSSSSRRHRVVVINSSIRPLPPPAPPLTTTTTVLSGLRHQHLTRGDGDNDDGGEEDGGDGCEYEEQEVFGDDDMVLG